MGEYTELPCLAVISDTPSDDSDLPVLIKIFYSYDKSLDLSTWSFIEAKCHKDDNDNYIGEVTDAVTGGVSLGFVLDTIITLTITISDVEDDKQLLICVIQESQEGLGLLEPALYIANKESNGNFRLNNNCRLEKEYEDEGIGLSIGQYQLINDND
jgi:hypothetical protein